MRARVEKRSIFGLNKSEDVEVALNIWGKKIAALKVKKKTSSKLNKVARDYERIPMDLLELHQEVFY